MTNRRRKDRVNEELPDEHEVIHHSLRHTSADPQQDKTRVRNNAAVNKADGATPDNAGSPAGKKAGTNKPR